ncbi:elongator complex protein 2 [Panulirus ornatus]|uniref:elongator complex protein 2 n=1 Tax=Panulirus ornatus TaxID=150431 RepID=UPI003A8A86EF
MEARVNYISSGVNQVPLNIDWGPDGTVCYAASTGVLLYDPKNGVVTGAGTKIHTNKVTCVRWVHPTPSTGRALISTGSDTKAVLWTISEEEIEGLCVLRPCAVLDHEDAVPLADATVVTRDGKEKILVVTVIVDTLTSWLVCPLTGEFECLNAFAPPARTFVMSLQLFDIEGAKYPALVCGGHDSKIHILTACELGHYYPVAVLNGHEDWVMTLDFMKEDDGCLLLASGSKDASVRLWRFSYMKSNEQLQDTLNAGNKELRLRSIIFNVPSDTADVILSVLLDAILAGHEGLVSEVHWARPVLKDSGSHQPYKLLTCSKTQDRSIIIWEPEGGSSSGSGMWLEVARLGEVGGNMEGYYSCQFSPDTTQVLGCSYQGGLHLWEYQAGAWQPCVVVGGHFDEVADITWDPQGRYLLSVSKDQTTRLHAPWKKTDGEVVWHEVGRPQVHGYDLACICSLGKYSFASGAEEKVIRGFVAPANFIRNFGQICGIDVQDDVAKCEVGEGASVPSLGLSNKAVMMADLQEEQQIQDEGKEEVQAYFRPLTLFAPATEDQLMQNTLWPEAAKLYGHGNDLIAMAASSDGTILASSCRAANNIDAQIILWDTATWHKLDVLFKHRLTVTQMAFSPDDKYLLSVSRDRTWTVFKRETVENGAGFTYRESDFSSKKDTMHSRVIWSCAWLPDSHHFVTASRDKTVALWGLKDNCWVRKAILNESNEVTSVAVTRNVNKNSENFLLATGLVNGDIHIRQFNSNEAVFSEEILQIFHKHQDTVRHLQFKPALEEFNDYTTLASCADDKRVHLYEIKAK